MTLRMPEEGYAGFGGKSLKRKKLVKLGFNCTAHTKDNEKASYKISIKSMNDHWNVP